jgi:hypothetical protein
VRLATLIAVAGLLVASGRARSEAPTAPTAPARSALETACIRLVTECAAARAAANRDPMTVEHPPGVLFKTTSPAATRHVVNAIAIARGIVRQYGALPPGCARACDGFLR